MTERHLSADKNGHRSEIAGSLTGVYAVSRGKSSHDAGLGLFSLDLRPEKVLESFQIEGADFLPLFAFCGGGPARRAGAQTRWQGQEDLGSGECACCSPSCLQAARSFPDQESSRSPRRRV